MANNYRRYQSRRSTGAARWIRFLVFIAIVVILILIGRAVLGGNDDNRNSSNTNEPDISLVNDAADANSEATDTPANANRNTTSEPLPPELATVPEGVCEQPLSKYGTAKVAVLTFEMSAANDNATALLAQLQKEKIPASFFSVGKFAENNPALLKLIADAGYGVYNRGYDSTNLTTLTAEEIAVQLAKAAASIEAATGAGATPFLRPAFSASNATVVTAATAADYCIILGTVDATDWQEGVTVAAAVDRVMGKLTPGMIIQLHAGYDITAATVTGLVSELTAAGYSLVALPTLVNA